MKIIKRVVASIVLVLGVFLFCSYSYAEEKGLVGYWNFDEGKGDIVKDLSGNGNDGTIHGAVATAGKIGQALSFDGVNDYVTVGNIASLNFAGDFTIEAWIYPKGLGGYQTIAGKQNIAGSSKKEYGFYTSVNSLYFVANDGSGDDGKVEANITISNNKMYHIVGVRDNNVIKMFVNGVQQDDTALTSGSVGDDYPFRIGTRATLTLFFNGIIDEVKVYNRALSAQEIKHFYDMGLEGEIL